jgi:hypothetical protein
MGRKKDKRDKLLLAEPEDLQALIERAQRAEGLFGESYTAPAWYQIGRLLRSDPRRWANCYAHYRPTNRWDVVAMFSVYGSVSAAICMLAPQIAWFWYFLLFVPLFLSGWAYKKSLWRSYERDVKDRFQFLMSQSPAEIVA